MTQQNLMFVIHLHILKSKSKIKLILSLITNL